MRMILLTPVLLLLTASIGLLACRAAGFDPHLQSMQYAALIAVVSAAAASAPITLCRRSPQEVAAQASLVSTMIHLFVSAALVGIGVIIFKAAMAFTFWNMAFYFVTLILVVADAVRLVKQAPTSSGLAPKQ